MTVWSASDKAPSVTLSNSNRTMSPSVANSGVRGTRGYSSGKYYYESKWDVGLGVTGIMTSATALTNGLYIGSDATGYSYAGDGNIYNNSVGSGAYSAPTTGDVIGIAVDFGALKMWVALNGTWQNGDPAAGTGGRAISAGTYYPAVSGQASSQQTGRWLATAFSQAVPSGFSQWAQTYSLTTAVGAFTLSGVAAGLRASRRMLAASATFVLTGVAAQLRGHFEAGAFVLSGIDVGLRAGRRLVAGVGSFVLRGRMTGAPARPLSASTATASTLTGGTITASALSGSTVTADPL